MTPKEFAHATMLVASLRTRLAHANALTAAVTTERDDLAKQLAAHVESLRLSNAQCAEYLRHNEMLRAELDRISAERDTMQTTLHSELVNVRAALASVTEQRDSLRRTLDEWERADTKPHEKLDPMSVDFSPDPAPVFMMRVQFSATPPVDVSDVADHVVPPVLPMCTTCHECGGELRPSPAAGSHSVLYCRTERCSRKNTAWQDEVSPYHGPCKSATPVRHE